MDASQIKRIVAKQKDYFIHGNTFNVSKRIQHLKKLKQEIIKQENLIRDALYKDLHKSSTEGYMTEIGMVLSELTFMIRHTSKYAKRKRVRTPLSQFHASSYQVPSPYGCVLVMSPWNYPFMLTMEPLIDAIAAGNTVVVKPSAYSKHTSQVIETILSNVFEPELVSVIQGGRQENQALLEESFDYIFFTGSPVVGKLVMEKASTHLTPVTLELGGKSPCIVDDSANISLAARRIVFGKFLNAGQTCVAPDYVYVHKSVKGKLIQDIQREIQTQYPSISNVGKIINEKHLTRLQGLIDPSKVIYGGHVYSDTCQIEPTIMNDVTWSDDIMQEEIFGPILPILEFDDIHECIQTIRHHPSPLALYLFSSNQNVIHDVETQISFGGGCINDTIIHLATSYMPFGGVGNSGMGQYHGKAGFDTFTHYKSMVNKKTWLDLPMRYAPYTSQKEKFIRMFLK